MRVARVALEAGENPGTGLRFWCPGCEENHVISLRPGGWKWNGDFETPTIDPSVKCESIKLLPEAYAMIERKEKPPAGEKYPHVPTCCHSVITAGLIRFCADSTHALVNRTVILPELELQPQE